MKLWLYRYWPDVLLWAGFFPLAAYMTFFVDFEPQWVSDWVFPLVVGALWGEICHRIRKWWRARDA